MPDQHPLQQPRRKLPNKLPNKLLNKLPNNGINKTNVAAVVEVILMVQEVGATTQ